MSHKAVDTEAPREHLLRSQDYDRLKFIAQIVLPALGTLYFALAGIWGLPKAEEVVGSIIAVDTFLGVVLSISTKSYNVSDTKFDGDMELVVQEGGQKVWTMALNDDPVKLEDKKQIVFKVKKPKEDS